MHFAALSGDADMVNTLLSKKADPNSRNDDGNTPLHLAALTAQVNVCRVLVEIGNAKASRWPSHRVLARARSGKCVGRGPVCDER